MASSILESVNDVNGFLSNNRNFAEVIQLLCTILVGLSFILPALVLTGNDSTGMFLTFSGWLFQTAVGLYCGLVAKIILYDTIIKKHQLPMIDAWAAIATFGFGVVALILIAVIIVVAPQVEPETGFGPSTLDFIELMTLFFILTLSSMKTVSSQPLFTYEPAQSSEPSESTESSEPSKSTESSEPSKSTEPTEEESRLNSIIAEQTEAERIEYEYDDLM